MAKVQTLALQDDAQAVGSLKSRQSVTLRPEVAGRVAEIAARYVYLGRVGGEGTQPCGAGEP